MDANLKTGGPWLVLINSDNGGPTVADIYDTVVPRIQRLHHQFDLDRVLYPELYGPVPKSVWRRLHRYSQLHP